MAKNPKINPISSTLKLYDGTKIKTIGTCELECWGNYNKYIINFTIIEQDTTPILGAPTCIKEGFIIVDKCQIKIMKTVQVLSILPVEFLLPLKIK